MLQPPTLPVLLLPQIGVPVASALRAPAPAAPLLAQPQGAVGGDEDGVAQGTLPLTPQDCFAVVTAGKQETTRLLENKFDYIFFTGTSREPEPQAGT